MSDREKVIKGLQQHCEGSMFDRCGECPYYAVADEPFQCRDAILLDVFALLKEKEQPEIVRCKDCKYWSPNTEFCASLSVATVAHQTPPDWFCADGVKR